MIVALRNNEQIPLIDDSMMAKKVKHIEELISTYEEADVVVEDGELELEVEAEMKVDESVGVVQEAAARQSGRKRTRTAAASTATASNKKRKSKRRKIVKRASIE